MYGFSSISPEQRLGIEIIKRAINDYMGRWYTGSTTESEIWETDAENWLFHIQDDYKEEHSFEWWCQFLNLSPDTIRTNIDKLKASEAERRSVRLTSVSAYEDAIFENMYGYDTEERYRIIGW